VQSDSRSFHVGISFRIYGFDRFRPYNIKPQNARKVNLSFDLQGKFFRAMPGGRVFSVFSVKIRIFFYILLASFKIL
jgi:hypothetical protein